MSSYERQVIEALANIAALKLTLSLTQTESGPTEVINYLKRLLIEQERFIQDVEYQQHRNTMLTQITSMRDYQDKVAEMYKNLNNFN